MGKKLAGLSVIVAFTAAAVAIWAMPPSLTKQAQGTAEATPGISLQELQQRIDIKSLPVQETADLM